MFQSWHQPVHFLVISIIAKYWCCLFSAFLPFFSCSPLNFSFNYPLTSYHWTFGETKRSPQRSQSHRDALGASHLLFGCCGLTRLLHAREAGVPFSWGWVSSPSGWASQGPASVSSLGRSSSACRSAASKASSISLYTTPAGSASGQYAGSHAL